MSAETQPQWKLDRLGQFGEPREFVVERDRVIAYAEATNDEHPSHRSGELAPPVRPGRRPLRRDVARTAGASVGRRGAHPADGELRLGPGLPRGGGELRSDKIGRRGRSDFLH